MGLLHGESSWERGQGLSGIARDIYEFGRSSGGHETSEKERQANKKKYDECIRGIDQIPQEELLMSEAGVLSEFKIKSPFLSEDRNVFYATYGVKSIKILNEWHDCEYATADKGDLLRKRYISEYWHTEQAMISLIQRISAEKRKKEISKNTFLRDVYVGDEACNVPCFKSIDHPVYKNWMWALLGGMCYHVRWDYDKSVETLDESVPAISLDDLYSF